MPTDPDRRLGEDGGRHRRRNRTCMGLIVEHGLGEGLGLADRHRGQVHPVGHIAHSPDVLHVGARLVVDGDGAPIVQFHSRLFEPETLDVRFSAGGEHHHLALDRHRVRHMTDQDAVLALLDSLVLASQGHLDAAFLELLRQVRPHVLIKAAQQIGAAISQCNINAQAMENTGKFDRNVTAADDHHSAWAVPAVGRPLRR